MILINFSNDFSSGTTRTAKWMTTRSLLVPLAPSYGRRIAFFAPSQLRLARTHDTNPKPKWISRLGTRNLQYIYIYIYIYTHISQGVWDSLGLVLPVAT